MTMMDAPLTFGEYLRRLRRSRKYSLHQVAERAELSYTHLSRLENDSATPRADTVARLAEALDGDLKVMLELADCLPRTILDRILSLQDEGATTSLKRRAPLQDSQETRENPVQTLMAALAELSSLGEQEVQEVIGAVSELAQLQPRLRIAVVDLIHNLASEVPDGGE